MRAKAISFRKTGLSHKEIAKKLFVSSGTIVLWTKGVELTLEQKLRLKERWIQNLKRVPREKLRELAIKNLSAYWKPRPSDKELLERIVKFHRSHKRIPLKREFNNTYKEYKKRFGGWNNAIKLAGFKTNPILYSYKFKAEDGHLCDSFAEKIIDDWLYGKGIRHRKNFPYLKTKMTADFLINHNIVVEFFGLAGTQKTYDETIKRKRFLCAKNGLKLIEIYPKDIIPKNRLSEIIK